MLTKADLEVEKFIITKIIFFAGKPWDYAPTVLLIKESGGYFENNLGNESIYTGGGCCYSNNKLNIKVLKEILGVI
ncbi:MAG: hypothetical protein U0457_16790 [Candidatus Sericytochromatia bacterium]